MTRIRRILFAAITALAALAPAAGASPARVASAAPLVLAPEAPDAPSVTRTYPGAAPCNTTLQACISASADGDVVQIQPGTYVTASVSVTRAVSIIGLGATPAGVKLRPTGGRMFTLQAPAMSAANVISNVTIENAVTSAGSGGAIRVNSGGGAPLFHSLVISNNATTFAGGGGGGIRVIPSVPVTLVNVIVFSNTATGNGGGVSVEGSLALINSHILRNRSAIDGGGLDVGGALVMTGSLVLTNTAVISGGGIAAAGAVTIENSTIASNTAQFGGGLLSVGTNAVVISGATTFRNNVASGVGAPGGGGILAYGDVRLAGGTSSAGRTLFKGNRAFVGGGGISSLGNVYFTRGFPNSIYIEFDGNVAQVGDGGGIRAFGEVAWLQSSVKLRMINNSAYSGGAVWAGTGLDLFLDPLDAFATLQNNAATAYNGGALYSSADATLHSGQGHAGNTASWRGGLLYALGDATLVGVDTSQTGTPNTAGISGGCVQAEGSVTLNNGVLAKCAAAVSGGAAYSGGWLRTFNGALVISNTAPTGAGLYASTFLTVEGGSLLRGNAASIEGGGAFAQLGALVQDSTWQSNTAVLRGGGLAVSDTGVITGGALFIGNRVTGTNGLGAGVFATRSLTVDGTYNTARLARNVAAATTGSGGAIASPGFVTLTNALIDGNESLRFGGGIVANSVWAISSTFFDNGRASTDAGGAISATVAHISRSTFIGNVVDHDGGAVLAGTVFITASTFITNRAGSSSNDFGGGVWANTGRIVSSYFENNAAGDEGAAVYFSSTATISTSQFVRHNSLNNRASAVRLGRIATVADSLFEDNVDDTATDGGGAIDIPNALSVEIRNSTFNNNRAWNGGAVRGVGSGGGSVGIYDSVFFNNLAFCCGEGGALWLTTAEIVNSTFISNYADCCSGGGAVYAYGNLWVRDSRFISNSVEERMDGGALLVDGNLDVFGSVFENNRVRRAGSNNIGRGGAIATESGTGAYFYSSQFRANRANNGGAMSCRGPCVVSDSRFESNLADQPDELTFTSIGRGGAIDASDYLEVERSRFIRNAAGAGGGGAIHQNEPTPSSESVRIVNSLFAENLASNSVFGARGNAVLITGTTNVGRLLHNTIVSDALAPGSAVAVYSGTFSAIDNIVVSHAVGIEHFGPGSTFENFNLFSGNGVNVSGTVASGGGSLVAAPQFVSPAQDVYHLKLGSPGVDAGTDVLVSDDVDGQPRPQGAGYDIGFDEGGLPRVFVPSTMRGRSSAW